MSSRTIPIAKGLVLLAAVIMVCMVAGGQSHAPGEAKDLTYAGNEACARCHASIYESYPRTPMAHASGPAMDAVAPADFVHEASGVHYRIYTEGGRVWLSFDRRGDPSLQGKRELLYYIGSGQRGRSYLFAVDGFLFESPINAYTSKGTWDMAPLYQNVREAPLNLPALTSCLQCHVSGMKPPVDGTENKYEMPPFTRAGVSCERCHGPGSAHLSGGPIVNPAKLSPDRRDAICMQCHLEGKAAVPRPGKHVYEFRPGDDLSNYVRYYVLDTHGSGLGAVSQFEALAHSKCKQMSGDKMSCTSCHDPHYSPPLPERASYFRGKCVACHGEPFASKHHLEQRDCTSCHMPQRSSTDIAHVEVTDHRILRKAVSGATPSAIPTLERFPPTKGSEGDARDLALAWVTIKGGGSALATAETEHLLRAALKQYPTDATILSSLAFVEQNRGAIDQARDLYHRALAADPTLIDAATNLGVLEASQNNVRAAIPLWQDAFTRAPWRSTIGINLARALCDSGRVEDGRSAVLRVLDFNPDSHEAQALLTHMNATPSGCARP